MEDLLVVCVVAPLTVFWVCAWLLLRCAMGMPRLAAALFWFWISALEELVRSFLGFMAPFVEVVFCALIGDPD